jgi:hypothetical protein
VILLVLAVVFIPTRDVDKVRPPAGADRLKQFAAAMPAPQKVAVVRDGEDLIVWIGSKESLVYLASGPPCYVFDSHGKLVQWAPETGEGGEIDAFCRRAWVAEPIPVAEAIALCAREGD